MVLTELRELCLCRLVLENCFLLSPAFGQQRGKSKMRACELFRSSILPRESGL
jgi:hypothetical protein